MEATPEELEMVHQSFDVLNRNAEESGKAFFERLFVLHPDALVLFDHLTEETPLFENPNFQLHFGKVINTIALMILNLKTGKLSKNDMILKRLVVIHKKWNVKPEEIAYIKDTLLDVLNLESNSTLEAAWIKVLDILVGVFKERLAVAWL